ncbi:riboflavin biosynthesis protein RibF [Ureaplasma miroungigenitalium]|uniref:riboflavin biosynthesis protein RibF n=1 Tax=Ureaplasma miroungigenitalium TaxID=1042321 RepID=UPI0021E8E94E|nr:riboflavin biosynthesis protein RibF [Ureaplasma miroungigenitalium]MCV3734531.1 riboflavin biosynthesis protein RibF [Ureaplasma miroungigenitalium]
MIIELNNKNITNLQIPEQVDLVIGFFDGLHIGHKYLFSQSKKFSILTFKNIPRKKENLYPYYERLAILSNLENLVNIYVYDIQANNLPAQDFIDQYIKQLNPHKIIVGRDFLFGSDQKDSHFLKKHCPNTIVSEVYVKDISTSLIKKAIKNNQWTLANNVLLTPYYRCGTVVHGSQIGKSIGFATANIVYDAHLVHLIDGVYLTSTIVNNQTYKSITYIGIPKTIESRETKFIETHILDFHADIYNHNIKVIFHDYLAPNIKFKNLDALITAIKGYIKQRKKLSLNCTQLA